MATTRPPREPRKKGTSDLIPRILVAIPAVAFAVGIIYFGDWVFAAGIAALGLVCVHELSKMFARARPVRLAAMLAVVGLTVAGTIGDERQVLLALVCSLPLTFFLAVLSPVRERITASIAVTMLIIVWIGLGVAFAAMLRGLDHGGALVVMVLLGTFFGDTFAYFGGRLLGRRKLAPRISPNKTVEGLLCGIVVRDADRLVLVADLRRRLDLRHRRAAARARGRDRRADRRPVRVTGQARHGY